jgi:ferredoxin, 2Fe-2S
MSTITVHFIEHRADGSTVDHTVEASAGQSLMRAALAAGIDGIAADCGGSLVCATCHVWVDAAWSDRLAPPTPQESAMLEFTAAPRRPDSRLSCQIPLDASLAGLEVQLPPTQY